MPCIHCARREMTCSTGAASTSSRCEQAAPIQRVPQSRSGQQQLQQQLPRSRGAFTRAGRQCQFSPRQNLRLRGCHSQRQITPNCVQDQVIETYTSQRIGRCMLQGFAAAAVLSLLAPGPSYSAETLPIGLLKSWVVSFSFWACFPAAASIVASPMLKVVLTHASLPPLRYHVCCTCRNKLRVLDQWLDLSYSY